MYDFSLSDTEGELSGRGGWIAIRSLSHATQPRAFALESMIDTSV